MGCNPTPSINTSNHTLSTPKSTEAILKLDTKGHTALIRDIIVTKSGAKPKGLAYSSNGEFLMAGSGSTPNNVNIYSVKRKYKKIQSFKKHKNLTMAVAFLDNSTAISGGGTNFEIYIWDIATGAVKRKIEGVGASIWSVGVEGDSIAWGNEDDCSGKNCSKLQKSINLKNFSIRSSVNQNFKRISTTNGAYSLIHRRGGMLNLPDGILDIKKSGKTIASIIRGSTNGYRHGCYGFYQNYIISGGANGQLKI
jgi:WD40 repeat protein